MYEFFFYESRMLIPTYASDLNVIASFVFWIVIKDFTIFNSSSSFVLSSQFRHDLKERGRS